MLWRLMHTTRCYKMIHDPETGGMLNAEQLYELCLEAGYSPEEAGKAACARAYARLQKELPP